jgi:Fibronectin type III domain
MAKVLRLLGLCLCAVLLATRADASSLAIAWNPNTEQNLGGYVVAYGTASGRDDVRIDVGRTTSWTFSSAIPGSRYYFRVYAYNTQGIWSAPSNEVSATAPSDSLSGGGFWIDRTTLTFAATRAGSLVGPFTPAQSVVVTPYSQQPFNWTATPNDAWLRVSPTSGSGTGTFSVQLVSGSTPAPGVYYGSVTVSGPSGSQMILVRLRVENMATTTGIVGSFDTPIDGATNVVGAIPVTGWALDDIGVNRIQLFRDPVPGETGTIYLGDAAFVPGTRPDIEAAYSDWPLNDRAGWGFMILTNMLPDAQTGAATGGNGRFRIHAYATDAEGHVTYMGAKSFTVNNRDSMKPFGTIDTPGQGATVSGSTYVNFGWAISPHSLIPADGSTITVLIDGVPVGKPTYNNYRPDIANAFPGYANSMGAVGYYVFDTTRLSNGIHTIAWVATDNLGNSEGLGSRFFTVLNTKNATTAVAAQSAMRVSADGLIERVGSSTETLAEVPVANDLVEVQRAAQPEATPQIIAPSWTGEVHVGASEAEAIELRLANQFTDSWGGTYEGYLVVDGELRALPAGSSLDTTHGTFNWQPAAGFLGVYDLMFVRTWPEGWKTKIPVRITIEPKFDRHDRHGDRVK